MINHLFSTGVWEGCWSSPFRQISWSCHRGRSFFPRSSPSDRSSTGTHLEHREQTVWLSSPLKFNQICLNGLTHVMCAFDVPKYINQGRHWKLWRGVTLLSKSSPSSTHTHCSMLSMDTKPRWAFEGAHLCPLTLADGKPDSKVLYVYVMKVLPPRSTEWMFSFPNQNSSFHSS